MDISDYSSCVGLGGQASASSEIEVKVPKVETVPGGCLHFAISLVPEAHPLAEDRVATIVLLSGLDLPVPDSVIDKLSGQIQNVYFVIERGFSRTTSRPKVDCEGRPQFVDLISPEVFQGSQAALVEFDQENSMITVKIHRKKPPQNFQSSLEKLEKIQEKIEGFGKPGDKKDGEEKEGEEQEKSKGDQKDGQEEVDDANDDLIAFCEFNLWDLVDIERGNNQVDLLERITKTFDCLTPTDAIRVLSNECHSSMVNIIGRSLIELKNFKKSMDEAGGGKGGFLSALKSRLGTTTQGVFQEQVAKAQEAVDAATTRAQEAIDAAQSVDVAKAVDLAKGALLDKLSDKFNELVDDPFGALGDDPEDPEEENEDPEEENEDPEEENADQPDVDPEAVDVQDKIFIAAKQFKRTIASLRTLVGIFVFFSLCM